MLHTGLLLSRQLNVWLLHVLIDSVWVLRVYHGNDLGGMLYDLQGSCWLVPKDLDLVPYGVRFEVTTEESVVAWTTRVVNAHLVNFVKHLILLT